jgi:hypothetical protein
MIWIALIIPLIGATVLFIWFRPKLTWWEVLLPLAACLLFTTIFKLTVETTQTSDTEYWGDLGTRVEYHEPWSTWVEQTCSRQVPCGTEKDANGNTVTKYCTEYYDCSYCDETGPRWYLVDSRGDSRSISQEKYRELVRRWSAREKFVELNRRINRYWGCGVDGDKYVAEWDRNPLTSEPTTSTHSYENRVQAAHTAFDFPEVTDLEKATYKLYDYPDPNGYTCHALLGADSVQWMKSSEKDTLSKLLNYLNGDMGPRKQLRLWVLVFQDQPSLAANFQEALWKGGNKNEMVVCLGLSSHTNHLQWVKAFSWSPNRKLLVDIREDLMETEVFSGNQIYSVLRRDLETFERKRFREFSYLSVDPPTWAIVTTFIVTIIITVLLCYWAVVNDQVADKHKPWKTVTEWKRRW